MKIKTDLEKELLEAKKGYRFFNKLLRSLRVDECVLFLDNNLWKTGVDYFDKYASNGKNKKYLHIYSNSQQLDYAKDTVNTEVIKKVLSSEQIKMIIKAYSLCDLSKKLKVMSLTEPYDTHGLNMLGKKNVRLEDIICFDVYKMDITPML